MSNVWPHDESPPLRVLVVEDERVVARDLQACLEGLGHVVLALVASGEAALEQAIALRPDLILMDIRLEGTWDGIEAAQRIWDTLQIPVIYTTGYSDRATVDRVTTGTFFGYLLKPVKESELELAIKAALQRQQERELLTQQARAWPILEALGDGVLVSNVRGQVQFLNAVAENLTGWSLSEAQGTSLTDVLPLYDWETEAPIANPLLTVLETGEPTHLLEPVCLVRRDQQRRSITDSAAPLRDPTGKLSGAVLVFRDTSAYERLQALALAEQRRALVEEQLSALQALNQLKDNFLDAISHELRAPLTSIRLALDLLKRSLDLPNNTKVARYLTVLQTECEREVRLVNTLLELQYLEADAVEPTWCTFNFLEWLPDVIETYAERAESRALALRWQVPPSLPSLVTDAKMLTSVVRELLTNACKYTPPEGTITVTVALIDSALEFSVSNTGPAIAPIVLLHLFDKFYRVPGGDPWQQGGTGLGLALVKGYVDQLGGVITVTSDDNATVFQVVLPLEPLVSES